MQGIAGGGRLLIATTLVASFSFVDGTAAHDPNFSEIIESHQGQLWATANDGSGATAQAFF
jgi:hypothetical protein